MNADESKATACEWLMDHPWIFRYLMRQAWLYLLAEHVENLYLSMQFRAVPELSTVVQDTQHVYPPRAAGG